MTLFFICLAAGITLSSLYRIFLLLGLLRPTRSFPASQDFLPRVAIQLPLYNERAVAERLIRAVAEIDYPRERLEIQVLDDSTDDTTQIVERLRAEGLPIIHIRRESRSGFKAGALAHGMTLCQAELFAIFDADFVPPRDFLRKLVPHFQDELVGMVQARWTFLNAEESLLTRLQATYLNAHFAIEHEARFRSGLFFHFNGTAGIWRRKAIIDAGGWSSGTLTEDLDLSYRAHLRKWKLEYRRDVEVPSELPSGIAAMKAQQYRWVKGMNQVGKKTLPSLWKSSASLGQKLDASFHLLSGGVYLQTLGVCFLLYLWELQGHRQLFSIWGVNLALMAIYFAVGNSLSNRRSRIELLLLFPLGVALSVNGARATFSGWLGSDSPFVRTPKRGVGTTSYPRPADPTLWVEICLAVALLAGGWSILSLFAFGFTYLSLLGLKERCFPA